MGSVSPFGCGVNKLWTSLVDCKSGIISYPTSDRLLDPIEDSKWNAIPSRVAAPLPMDEWNEKVQSYNGESKVYITKLSRYVQFALIAAQEALQDANWIPQNDKELQSTGVSIGSGIGSLEEISDAAQLLSQRQIRKISPFFIPRILTNMAAGYVSIRYGFMGPNHTASTACATGAHSIGDAYRMIQADDANVMVCGGTESSLDALSFAGFCRGNALSTKYNNSPRESSRPFDSDRCGFVMGEGCGILVLEELQHALDRKANIHAEIVGYGLGADAFHITAPRPDGRGQQLVIERALRSTNRPVQYVNAHATSTPAGDLAELEAVKNTFKNRQHQDDKVHVSSIKGAVGHLLGAAGSVEAIATIKALKHNMIPPTLNLKINNSDQQQQVILCGEEVKHCEIDLAISNSFGFGGTNACLAFSKYKNNNI
ncbi:3-oxoacyl-[acyl-carrier-protein] synthase II, mitochondrial [Acrasis kona]|uniref:3-oxoacyl-[acyl-carrier-protein] synthase n=1 Tax=Acrasis kona TaxID=1008807 RepID=A0AAW2ZBM8_9EUKA